MIFSSKYNKRSFRSDLDMSLGFAMLLFVVWLVFLIPEAIYNVQNDPTLQKNIGRGLDIVVIGTELIMDVTNNKDVNVIEKDMDKLKVLVDGP